MGILKSKCIFRHCLSLLSISVIKHCEKKQSGEGRVCYFQFTVLHGGKMGQELHTEIWM